MIYWLLQSNTAHPDLARGIPPGGLLNPAEEGRLAGLKTAKRRRDWLLGRWTAKHLLQSYVEQRAGLHIPLDAVAIESEPSGAPRVEIRDWRLEIEDKAMLPQSLISNLQSLSLSISHSADCAFCAIAERAIVGADIEHVEPRAWQFAEDYFTAEEIARFKRAPSETLDMLITAIWSAKEAALKALRLGLTVDTRCVECRLAAGPADGWGPIVFAFDTRRLGREAPVLAGWWRLVDKYVVTIATF